MRREEYTDHPMAFYARLGIFLPPLMVAAFASLIRPYPDKRHDFHKTGKDFSNPTLIMAATHCGVSPSADQLHWFYSAESFTALEKLAGSSGRGHLLHILSRGCKAAFATSSAGAWSTAAIACGFSGRVVGPPAFVVNAGS